MIEDVIGKAESAKETWEKFVGDHPDQRLDRYFHLRPKSRDITLVTTHKARPMRGIGIATTKLYEALCVVNDAISGESVDWNAIKSEVSQEFKEGHTNKEFPIQARMINEIHGNAELKTKLGVGNLYFAASELILQQKDVKGGKKIDIVGHDGTGRVFLFELKASKNARDDPKTQVEKYLDSYGKGGPENEAFERLMKTYPMHPIPSLDEYFSYAVVGYGEKIKKFIPAEGKSAGRIEME
jgi:hypothetical protein